MNTQPESHARVAVGKRYVRNTFVLVAAVMAVGIVCFSTTTDRTDLCVRCGRIVDVHSVLILSGQLDVGRQEHETPVSDICDRINGQCSHEWVMVAARIPDRTIAHGPASRSVFDARSKVVGRFLECIQENDATLFKNYVAVTLRRNDAVQVEDVLLASGFDQVMKAGVQCITWWRTNGEEVEARLREATQR